MNYWNTLLSSPLNQLTFSQNASSADDASESRTPSSSLKRRVIKVYYIDQDDKTLYLTQREAECVIRLVKGLTIKDTGKSLKLSARTIEFYLKNVKKKLNVKTKSQLIQRIYASDFLQLNDWCHDWCHDWCQA